jgi:hypothetical protein
MRQSGQTMPVTSSAISANDLISGFFSFEVLVKMEKGSGCNFNRIEYDILKWLQIKLVSTPKGNFSQCKGNMARTKRAQKTWWGASLGLSPCLVDTILIVTHFFIKQQILFLKYSADKMLLNGIQY